MIRSPQRAILEPHHDSLGAPRFSLCLRFCFIVQSVSYAQTPGRPHVYLTHLKAWLASGGLDQKLNNLSKQNSGLPDYTKEFQRHCARVILTDLEHADYAVAIDDKELLSGLTNAEAAKFQYEVYSRSRPEVPLSCRNFTISCAVGPIAAREAVCLQ